MADVKAKVHELEQIKARVGATLDQYKTGLTAEKNLEVETLLSRAGELKGEIEVERKMEAKMADLANLDEFLNKPEQKVPHGIGDGEDDDRKALRHAGWEFKQGIVYAPTSQGKMTPMFGEDVLFGPIPTDDPDAAMYFKSTRASFDPGYRAAWSRLIRLAAKYRTESMAYNMLTPSEQKALSEGTDTAGGFLVPPDLQAELLVRVAQQAVMRQLARVVTTSRDVLKWPLVAANTSTPGSSIYSSGFVGGWAGEVPTSSDTDPTFGTFDIPIRKARVSTRLSNDFVADSSVNVLAFLAQNGAENLALVEDQGFINGDGTALQPKGILQATGLTTVDVEGSTTDTISNTTSSTGSAPKLIDVVYSVPSQYANRGKWLFSRSIEGKVRKLVDGSGRFLWPAMTDSGFADTPGTLMGYGKYNSDWMPNDGTNANKVVLFGDFSAYVIAQRAQITSTILRERYADSDQIGIILWERVGGDTWNPDALRVGIV